MNPYATRRSLLIVLLAALLLILGTAGYVLIEGWTFNDALYMTVITLSTVGFGEVHPLSRDGRLFTSALVVLSVFLIAYGVEFVISARISGQFVRRRQLLRQVKKMENHVIICGLGRVGRSAALGLLESGRQTVVIDKDIKGLEGGAPSGVVLLEGDATDDELLLEAGIKQAWGLIACTGDDSVNLFIVLSARALCEGLYLIARSDQANESKMRRAGANRIVSPYEIGGRHMANIAVRPHVTDFFDVVTLDGGLELWLEELIVHSESPLVGKTLGEADIRHTYGVTVVAVVNQDERSTYIPSADTPLDAGLQIIVLGTREQLALLEMITTTEFDMRK